MTNFAFPFQLHRRDVTNTDECVNDMLSPGFAQPELRQSSFSKFSCNFIWKNQDRHSETGRNIESRNYIVFDLISGLNRLQYFFARDYLDHKKFNLGSRKSSSRWKTKKTSFSKSFTFMFSIVILTCFVKSTLARRADTRSSTASLSEKRNFRKPFFSEPVKMRQRNFIKPEGGTVNFRCKAKGKPRPRIQWYKDGNATGPDGSRSNIKPLWVLTLRNVQEKDGGKYTCSVWNSAGKISFDYSLQVVGTEHERPVLLEPHPINTTVVEGEKTSLQCRVRSAVPPTVKWIKLLDPDSISTHDGELPANALHIDNKFYLVLPAQEMMAFSDGTYLNKLVIKRTRLSDTGMYICLGANTMGYNFRYAHLVVTPKHSNFYHEQVVEYQSFPLAVVVAVPAVVALLIVAFVIFCCMRNQERLGQWSRDQERKRSNVQYEAGTRLSSSSSSTANVGVGMETQDTVETLVMQRTPESTFERPKNSRSCLNSLAPSCNLIESDVASNYIVPPSPPPPSQLSHVSSMTSSSRHSRNRLSCNHQNHHHHHHRYHRSRNRRNHEDEFHSLRCTRQYNLSDQVTV